MSTDETPPSTSSSSTPATAPSSSQDLVPFRTALRAWFLISLQTFGGPAGQIAVMQRTLVEDRRWIGQQRFNHALNFCMILPGPEAQQLAVYVGWLLNGLRGAISAGVLFVLPGMVALLALSGLYVAFGETTAINAVFAGLAPAVLAIIVQAVIRVSRRSLVHPILIVFAVASFAALTFFSMPFPLVIALAALAGWLVGRLKPALLTNPRHDDTAGPPPVVSDENLHHESPSIRRSAKVMVIGVTLWLLPVAAVALFTGASGILTTQGLFFSGTALVTFGGAYAVLAFVAQRAVETYAWLAPGEMVRGLALAESTPGPLIMVVQFVAFLGAFRNPGVLDPWVAGVLASLLTTWVTFTPSFLFILLGAPYIERLRNNKTLSAALTGVTAAVVGVIANLALYFALNTLFTATTMHAWGPASVNVPDPSSLEPVALGLLTIAVVLTFVVKWPILRVLGVCALLGLCTALLPW